MLICLLLSFNAECTELPMIAVLDLKPEKTSVSKAITLSRHLREELGKTGKVVVLKREEMGKILTEQKDQLKGCIEEECAIKVGKLLNVEDVIAGSILKVSSEKYVLYIKLLSVKDEMVFNRALRAEVNKDELTNRIQDYADILSKIIIVSTGKIAKIDKDDIYIKLNSEVNLATGMILRTVRQGEPIKDRGNGEILGYKKEEIGMVEIKEIVEDTLAIAKKIFRCKKIQLGDIIILPKLTRAFKDVYEFLKVEIKPKLLMEYYVEPEYPEFAKKAEIEGQVILKCLIDTTGQVIFVEVIKSLHSLCDGAAIKAMSQWRYSPAKLDGDPVKVWVVQPVRFKL